MKPVFATYYRTVRSDQYLKIKYVWPIKNQFRPHSRTSVISPDFHFWTDPEWHADKENNQENIATIQDELLLFSLYTYSTYTDIQYAFTTEAWGARGDFVWKIDPPRFASGWASVVLYAHGFQARKLRHAVSSTNRGNDLPAALSWTDNNGVL